MLYEAQKPLQKLIVEVVISYGSMHSATEIRGGSRAISMVILTGHWILNSLCCVPHRETRFAMDRIGRHFVVAEQMI